MGLNVTLTTFAPATVIASAPVNSNFAALNTASGFVGGVPKMNFDGGALTSDGNGNINGNNGLGKDTKRDIFDWSTTSDTYVKATSATGALYFLIGTPSSGSGGTPTYTILSIDSTGIHINANSIAGFDSGLVFQTGSLSRSSTFTGNASGVYNHGNNGTPSVVLPTSNSSGGLAAIGFSSPTPSQVYISEEFGDSFKAWAVAF